MYFTFTRSAKHLRHLSSKKRKNSGQTIVEYVLLLAMVAGAVTLVRSVMLPKVVDTLSTLMSAAGGRGSQGGADRYGSHYAGSSTFKK